MNAVVARVLDCFYLMEHSMVHQYKCRDCKNTVFCISNMQKTVFLQSLRLIFKKKIHFWGITECSKHYFSNSCIDHFKTKVAWIHHNIQEILLLPSLHLSICQVVWLSGCQVVTVSSLFLGTCWTTFVFMSMLKSQCFSHSLKNILCVRDRIINI